MTAGTLKFISFLLLALLVQGCTILDDQRWPVGEKKILLTIDDGPNGSVSEDILDVLARHQVKAAFCLIGRNIEKHPQIARRIYSEGHQIVLHGQDKSWPYFFSRKKLARELQTAQQSLETALAKEIEPISYYRPPRGLVTPAVKQLTADGSFHLAWLSFYFNDASADETKSEKVAAKLRELLNQYQGGAIVLHESRYKFEPENDNSIDKRWLAHKLDEFILWARQEGYEFVLYADEPAQAGR